MSAKKVLGPSSPLPRVPGILVDALTDMLAESSGSKKPPRQSGALLALIRQLNKRNQPWPKRQAAAAHLGTTTNTIDAALSRLLAEGYIDESVETVEGNVQQRAGIVRHKFYKLTSRVQLVANDAERVTDK